MTELLTSEPPAPREETETEEPNRDIHPTAYVHERCGGVTEMPANIRANYLADPYFYSSGTICATCGGEVPDQQCTWVETGENLRDYMWRLKKSKSQNYHTVRRLLPFLCGFLLMIFVLLSAQGQGRVITPAFAVGAWGLCTLVAWFPCKFIRLAMCRMGWI